MELKDSYSLQHFKIQHFFENPFNGIESSVSISQGSWSELTRIHSMELKDNVTLSPGFNSLLSKNPFNGIERSKLLPARLYPLIMYESIQWN